MPVAIAEFATREALMQAASQRIAEALQRAIAKHGSACAALSGGVTPAPAYRMLAAAPLDWERITFALVDERFVPPSHDASNEAMIRKTLQPAFAAGAHFAPMYAQTREVGEAADVANALYAPLRIDIAVMGMGADGHTASWFPQADALGEALDATNPRTVVALHAANAQGSADRLTLTRAALSRARALVLLITGGDKRARLDAALAGENTPVSALFESGMPTPDVLWAP